MSYCFFFFKQKTAYEMRMSDWSSDVCSSDLLVIAERDIMQIGAVAEDRAKPAGRPGKRLEGDQLRLRPAGTRERAELTLVGADVDHGGGFDPDKRRPVLDRGDDGMRKRRSDEHTSDLQSLMRISYAVFCLKKKIKADT